jgi:hypothetical protein
MKKFNMINDIVNKENETELRLTIDQALQENKDVCFTLYNTIDSLTIYRDSEITYKLIHECGSKEIVINSSVSEENISDLFIDCILSMYSNKELSNGYIEIK